MQRRQKQNLTLGDLIRVVAQCSHNDHEVGLAVADLMQRGVVRLRHRSRAHRRFSGGH